MFERNHVHVPLLGTCVKPVHEKAPPTYVYKYVRGSLPRRAYIIIYIYIYNYNYINTCIYASGGQRVKDRSYTPSLLKDRPLATEEL